MHLCRPLAEVGNDHSRLPRLRDVAAFLSPSTQPGERVGLHFRPTSAALPQIRVATLIGYQANYEIKLI